MPGADLPLEHVHVEPDRETDGPAPAAFVLHGRGADEHDLLPVARQLPDSLAVVSLRAPGSLMGGYTWYDLDLSGGDLSSSQPDPGTFERSRDAIRSSVTAATEAYGLDPDRIGLLGFSQGAVMSFAYLLDRPASCAWIAGLHGYLPEALSDRAPEGATGVPVFVAAGADDEIIPADRAQAAAERLREVGCDVTFEVYDGGHGISRAELDGLVNWVAERERQD